MDATQPTRDELILSHFGLVKYIGMKYAKKHDFDDIFQVGYVGLIKAARAFDESYGVPFNTYAGAGIKNEICGYLRKVRRWRRCVTAEGRDDCLPLADVADQRAVRDAEVRDVSEAVSVAIAGLHPAKRKIMSMRWVDGYSVRETSEILGLTEGHIINHSSRAKPVVRNRILELIGD